MAERPDASLLSEAQYADHGSRFSLSNRLARVAWQIVWLCFFRPTPRALYRYRSAVLRLFGAKLGRDVRVSPSVRIWAPWNLHMQDHSSMGDAVDCYSVSTIEIGRHGTVSQYSFLCTASHDHETAGLPGFQAPIVVGDYAWVCADVFVAPGVTVGEGTVVGARSSVFASLEPWVVAAGTPARPIRPRVLKPRTR